MRQVPGCAWCRMGSLAHSFGRRGRTPARCEVLFKAQSGTDQVPALLEHPFHWGKKEKEQADRESCQLLINAIEKTLVGSGGQECCFGWGGGTVCVW